MKIRDCEYPDELLYAVEDGIWARESDGEFVIGAAPTLGWISGGFMSVTLKPVGTKVARGKVMGSIEGPRHFDVLRAPFDCTVVGRNGAVLDNPRLANKSPYDEGWLVELKQSGKETSLVPLVEGVTEIRARLVELRVHCFAAFPDVEMYEIGVECAAVLSKLSELIDVSPPETTVHVVSDDPTAAIEMERWQMRTGNSLLETKRDGTLYHFIVKKREGMKNSASFGHQDG